LPIRRSMPHRAATAPLSDYRCAGPGFPGVLDLAWPVLAWFTNRVFAEDCAIVEMEQAAYDQQGTDRNQDVFPPILDLRKLLRQCGKPLAS
jgi:renierapurpurin 18,18'-hydroxylase